MQHQLANKEHRTNARPTQSLVAYKDHNAKRFSGSRYDSSERKYELEAPRANYKGHADRIIRSRDDSSRSTRYGGSRVGTGPYDRHNRLT
ncbi:hypothetical protein YC2023_059902 [Brassica napus]